MQSYHAEIINLSLKDRKMIKQYPILNVKNVFLGYVKIYTISISENDIEKTVRAFQDNMGTAFYFFLSLRMFQTKCAIYFGKFATRQDNYCKNH